METKDIAEKVTYVLIAITAYTIKYFKEKKDRKKSNEDLRVEMAQLAQRIAEEERAKIKNDAAALVVELARREAEDKKRIDARKGIEANERIDREVRHAEQKILNEYKAQRMYIIHFSNGTVTEAGIHLMKITFKSEVIERYDVEKISIYFNEKPIPDMFKSPMRRALGGEYHYINDVDAMDKTDPDRKDYFNWLSAYRVKSVLWIPLRNNTGKVVAIMVAHWFAKTHFDERDISKIKDMKNDIEAIYDRFNEKASTTISQ